MGNSRSHGPEHIKGKTDHPMHNPDQMKREDNIIHRLGQDYRMINKSHRQDDPSKPGIETIFEKPRPHQDIDAQGYTVRFRRRVFFGYAVDIYAPDGRRIVDGTKVRKGIRAEFPDPMDEGLIVELRLGIMGKDSLSLKRVSEIMIESEEDVVEAVKMVAGGWKDVDPERLKKMMRHVPELNPLENRCSGTTVSCDAALFCKLCMSLGRSAQRGLPIESAFPSIVKLLANSDEEVRLSATFPLIMAVTYGQDITMVHPALQEALHDPCMDVRENAGIVLDLDGMIASRIRF